MLASGSASTCQPRPLRFIFCGRLMRPWRFMPGPARTLPVAVSRKRFLTEDLVFSLGICLSYGSGAREECERSRPGMPYRPGAQTGAAYSDAVGGAQAMRRVARAFAR